MFISATDINNKISGMSHRIESRCIFCESRREVKKWCLLIRENIIHSKFYCKKKKKKWDEKRMIYLLKYYVYIDCRTASDELIYLALVPLTRSTSISLSNTWRKSVRMKSHQQYFLHSKSRSSESDSLRWQSSESCGNCVKKITLRVPN